MFPMMLSPRREHSCSNRALDPSVVVSSVSATLALIAERMRSELKGSWRNVRDVFSDYVQNLSEVILDS